MKKLLDILPSLAGVLYGSTLSSSANNLARDGIHIITNLDEALTSRALDFFIALTPQVPSLESYEQFELIGVSRIAMYVIKRKLTMCLI